MPFQVFENDKPCDNSGFDWVVQGSIWDKSKYATFSEAEKYAKEWLGHFAPRTLLVNEPYSYSGYGDWIIIKEVP